MITQLIHDYFASLAQSLSPKLKQIKAGTQSWEEVFELIYEADSDLVGLLRRNYEALNVSELVAPTDLDQVNLGILSRSLAETDSQGNRIDFPTAPMPQNSGDSIPKISG